MPVRQHRSGSLAQGYCRSCLVNTAPRAHGENSHAPRAASRFENESKLHRQLDAEPFPPSLSVGQLKNEDSLGEAGDPSGRAPQFAEEPPGFEGGDDLLDEARIFARDRFTACWPAERASQRPQHRMRHPGNPCRPQHRIPASTVPCSRAAWTSWTAPGRAGESPGVGRGPAMTCTFILCFLCLAGVERPVGGDAVDRQERTVQEPARQQPGGGP